MSVATILVMRMQLVTTQLDLSCVFVIEDLLVMDLIVQVGTIKGGNCHSNSACTEVESFLKTFQRKLVLF